MIKKIISEVSLNSCAVLTGAVFIGLSAPAQDTNVPTVMKPTVVTGSYIPTAETVGPAPVQTLSTTDISEAGASDSLLTLKKLVPGFTGSGNYLGSVNNNINLGAGFQGFTGQSYAQIRNLPTLVLINGQRVVTSALSGAQAVDLNSIPLSAIERIEVLKDGASAIYGSDAIGGVINIITKQNFNGFELGGRVGFPTDSTSDDNGLQYKAYYVAGASTENTRFTTGAEIFEQNPLLATDRHVSSLSAAELTSMGIIPAAEIYFSPSFPGKVQGGGAWILAGSPFAQGRLGYNPSLNTPPKFGTNQFTTVAGYNAYAIAHGYVDPTGNGMGPYLPFDTSTLLNTTLFGTTSILEQDRRQFWANLEQDLFPEHLTFYTHFLYADNSASGQLAPSPVIALYNPAAGYQIAVPGNNPYNPFGIDLGLNGATSPRIRSRFVDSGNRFFDTFQDTYQWVGGLKGKITPDYGYDASFDYSHSREEQQTRNAINGAALNQALIPNGQVDPQTGLPLSQLNDANGNAVPVYNIFSGALTPGTSGNSPATIKQLQTTLFTWGQTELWNAQGVFNGNVLDLPAGKLAFAAGGQFIHENLQLQVDGLTAQGLVPGLNPQQGFHGGTRETGAGFIEVNIPVFSKDMHVPAFYDLEVTVAGRYQSFDPGGDAAVPKVAVRWQPIDEELTLRGSYNQGFIAPSIFNLFGPDFVNNPAVTTPGGVGQVTTTTRSNPNLKPQSSEQFGFGAVISPKPIKNLTLSADYYHVNLNNVPVADAQGAANSLNALGSASPFASGFTFVDGTKLTTTAPNQVTVDNWGNLVIPWSGTGSQRVMGIDFAADYVLPLDPSIGRISLDAVANLTLANELSTSASKPKFDYTGTYTPVLQGLIPDYTLTVSLTYQYQGFTFVTSAHYIPETQDPGLLFPEYGQSAQGSTINGLSWTIPSYYTIDMQLSYEFGKGKVEGRKWYDGTRLTVGVNNITDEQPPVIADSQENNTDKNNYDIIGRFLYFEVSKKF